ncbi:MAG TPA: hypothetical protein VF997_00775 [Polyangia bacterium]
MHRSPPVALFSLVLAWCVIGCAAPEPRALAPRPAGWRVDRVVLVTVDGVRWQDIAAALDGDSLLELPSLRGLAERGVALVGDVQSSAPFPVSLPGYREILTGRRGAGDCLDNECAPIAEPTLLDELAAAGCAPAEVAEVASWEGLALAAAAEPARVVVTAGRHGGATRALVAVDCESSDRLQAAAARRDFVDHPDYRRDADTMELALGYLAAARPRWLHVALGDTDIHAHAGNRRGYLDALVAADALVGRIGDALDRIGGESLVVVTTDHGRGPDLRDHGKVGDGSARAWLVAAGGPIAPRGRVHAAAPYRLADLAPSLRALLGLAADDDARAGHAIPELAAR